MSTSKDFIAGDILTAAQIEGLPQGVLALGSSTSDVGPTSVTTTLDLLPASAVILATANRRLRLSYTFWSIDGSDLGSNYEFRFQEGSTILARRTIRIDEASVGTSGHTITCYVSSPTAASHTYKVTLTRLDGTGGATIKASADAPAQLAVEDVGIV